MTRRLLHVGIVVGDLDRAVAKYCGAFGFEALGPAETVSRFNIRIVRLRGDGVELELAQPLQEQSEQGMRKGVHHLAFATADLKKDAMLLFGGAIGEDGKAFLPPDPNEGGLSIELIEQ